MDVLKVGDYVRVNSCCCVGVFERNPIGKITSMSFSNGSPVFTIKLIGGGTIFDISIEDLERTTDKEVTEAYCLFSANKFDVYFNNWDKDCENKITTRIVKKVPPVHDVQDIPLQCVVKRIIYNDPATIVFWSDGTKTIVKRAPGEKYNRYFAFCAALAKKVYGNNTQVNKIVNSGYNQLVNDIVKSGKKMIKLSELRKKKLEDGERAYMALKNKIEHMRTKQHLSYANIAKKLDMAESSVRNIAREVMQGKDKNNE